MARVCIVCQKETDGGYKVADDFVIRAIRKAKQQFNVAKNNTLVVEAHCLEEHIRRREKFEKSLVTHVVIAGIALAIFVLLPLFSGNLSFMSILLGIILAALIVGLSAFSHWPKTADNVEKNWKQKGTQMAGGTAPAGGEEKMQMAASWQMAGKGNAMTAKVKASPAEKSAAKKQAKKRK